MPLMLLAYDQLISDQLAKYLRNSRKMDDLVETQVRIIAMTE